MPHTISSPLATSSRSPRTWLGALLAAPVLAIVLAGCTPSVSSPTPVDDGAGQGAVADSSAARDAYDLELAECLRAQGLDVKDPLPGKGIVEDTPEIREAFPACSAEIGDPPAGMTGPLTNEQLTGLLERAKCLREKGYEIEEPTADNPGFIPAEVSEADYDACDF